MPVLHELVEAYHKHVTFAFVYILEAHAIDEWPVPCNNRDVKQHKSLADRANAAHKMMQEFPLPPQVHLLLDSEDNSFNTAYASWPFRYWVIEGGILKCKLMPQSDLVSMDALKTWLEDNVFLSL